MPAFTIRPTVDAKKRRALARKVSAVQQQSTDSPPPPGRWDGTDGLVALATVAVAPAPSAPAADHPDHSSRPPAGVVSLAAPDSPHPVATEFAATPALEEFGRALELLLRDYSNVQQQLHHSFNTYVMTSLYTHVSSGLYYYPVFAIQGCMVLLVLVLPRSNPFQQDFFGILVGLFLFLLLTASAGAPLLISGALVEGSHRGFGGASTMWWLLDEAAPMPTCGVAQMDLLLGVVLLPGLRKAATLFKAVGGVEQIASVLGLSGAGADCGLRLGYLCWLGFLLFAFRFYLFKQVRGITDVPVWLCLKCGAVFCYGLVLGGLTVFHYSLGVFATVMMIPVMVLVVPWGHFRRRGKRFLVNVAVGVVHRAVDLLVGDVDVGPFILGQKSKEMNQMCSKRKR